MDGILRSGRFLDRVLILAILRRLSAVGGAGVGVDAYVATCGTCGILSYIPCMTKCLVKAS